LDSKNTERLGGGSEEFPRKEKETVSRVTYERKKRGIKKDRQRRGLFLRLNFLPENIRWEERKLKIQGQGGTRDTRGMDGWMDQDLLTNQKNPILNIQNREKRRNGNLTHWIQKNSGKYYGGHPI